MSTRLQSKNKAAKNEDIILIENVNKIGDYSKSIKDQIIDTNISNTNLLQHLQAGLYLITIKRIVKASLELKKLSDKAQYSILPMQNDNAAFGRLSLQNLKNYCYGLLPPPWLDSVTRPDGGHSCTPYFYYQIDHIQTLFNNALSEHFIGIKEVLSNRTLILSKDDFCYPLPLAKLAALALWQNRTIEDVISHVITDLHRKFALIEVIYNSLCQNFHSGDWNLLNGQMRYTHQGVTRPFDYANLVDDIEHAGYSHRVDEYLNHFRLNDLDTSASFPCVSLRSPIYLSARPASLSSVENGYVIVATKDSFGKQTPIETENNAEANLAFGLWLKRADRHLFRHQYKARVVLLPRANKTVLALVGQQIATVAIFPALVKSIFDNLHLNPNEKLRMIAHNEDVLTIASESASWIDINDVTEKAIALFKLVAADGADPLSLFEEITLPKSGVGNFQLKTVPDKFFELISSAVSLKQTIPPGHDHYLLGLAYECLHEWGLAVVEFQKALRFDAKDPDILHGLGCALMEIGQVEEAMPFLKRAFDLMPENPEVADNLGRLSLECGDIADAIKAFERAVTLSPGSADYLKNLGDGYLLASRINDALVMLNRAIRCDPLLASAHASLANIHLVMGDEEKAKEHALVAYRENPVDVNIANLLWRLTLQKK